MQSGIRLDRLLFSNGKSNEFRYPKVRMVIQLRTKGAMEARRVWCFLFKWLYIYPDTVGDIYIYKYTLIFTYALPETNSSHLKIDPYKKYPASFWGPAYFSGGKC